MLAVKKGPFLWYKVLTGDECIIRRTSSIGSRNMLAAILVLCHGSILCHGSRIDGLDAGLDRELVQHPTSSDPPAGAA
jgi:hypothetical protein